MIALVLASVLHLGIGETTVLHVDYSPSMFITGASFRSEDPSIATASGSIPARGSKAKVEVVALKEGSTRLLMVFKVGLSRWETPVADVIVGPCVPPTIALVSRFERINEGEAVTLMAMTTGTGFVQIDWHEGDAFLGTGTPLTLRSLGAGTHRITSRALNRCGIVTSEEVVVEVIAKPRKRRIVRHDAFTPNPIRVAVGETIDLKVPYTGPIPFTSFDSTIAEVRASAVPGQPLATITVRGIREGTTKMGFQSGGGYVPFIGYLLPVRREPVADVIVGPCVPPALTFDAPHIRLTEGSSITVTAMTTGTGLGFIEWSDGTQILGLAPSMTFTSLPIGTHRFTARVSNACGAARHDVVIEVVEGRRRGVRH